MPWQYTSPPSTIAASSDKDALPCVPPSTWICESVVLHVRTNVCPTAAFWIVALFLTSLKFWAQLLHAAHSCSNSAFPEIYKSLSKKPFSSVPRWKKSASHHPCFILRGVLLQVARSFEQFVKKESKTWRGTNVRLNAFNKCEQLGKHK